MNKRVLFHTFCLLILAGAAKFPAQAFPANKYATTSRLATGKWVKITIPEDGIYQITYKELNDMGFENPADVRIYGWGGHPMSEILSSTTPDDLVAVPCKHFGDKLCFYGCGPTQYTLDVDAPSLHFIRSFNSYSQNACYFITSDDGTPPVVPMTTTYSITGQNLRNTSLDYYHHENEISSASQSGKDLLGETIENGFINIPYSLFESCADSSIVVTPCVAVKSDNNSLVWAKINDKDANFAGSDARIYASSSKYVFYNSASPSATVTMSHNEPLTPEGNVSIGVNNFNNHKWVRLDYLMLTYYHNNTLDGAPDNQLRMAFNNVRSSDIIAINKASENIQLWNIDNPQSPKNYTLNQREGYSGFTPLYQTPYTQFIAFDPTKELKSISSYEEVDNQNIHALPVPDMVIVTCEELLPQAERVAQMHRDNDNMVVHVLDQQKIFNEFSSGTPDAMGIRLMCKMFYDRDTNHKFKHLLMFGASNYDNRQIILSRDCTILTYESTLSNDETNSYVSDDFFGMLDDNSGKNPAGEMLRLGVGRIPCASLKEAESDVDKLLNYVNNPDYGPWRNNALYIADYVNADEGNIHSYQAEGMGSLISNTLEAGLMKNKVYVTQFPTDPVSNSSVEGKRSVYSQLQARQYFMTYVGHANPVQLTRALKLWTSNDSKSLTNSHLPIVTTACCDVARFDGDERGLMETMFHNPNGGAIAMVASTRSAYAYGNDALNQAFAKAMFCYTTEGHMPTLGEAYMLCKQAFGQSVNYNKMMFVLLGDPAIKINYPKPYFKITKINGNQVGTSSINSGALQTVTVEAMVYTPDGTTVDNTFNGDATLTIYDYEKKETTYNNRDIFFPRSLLTQVTGRVVNGVFNGQAVIPRYTLNPGAYGLLSVYAHRDNSDEMVNGSFDKLILAAYSATNSHTVNDNTPPTIDAIYFNNEEEFQRCTMVPTNSTLYIRATDDYSFNNQYNSLGNSMDIKLDGGIVSYSNVSSFSTMLEGGKVLMVQMPMNLTQGSHTLEYTVYDVGGNRASRTINFSVGGQNTLELTVAEQPALRDATFNIETTFTTIPDVEIKVFDHLGYLKWHTTTSNFPYHWDLRTNSGSPLPAGVYHFYGKYNDGTTYGGTSTGTLIIAK